MLPSLWNSVRAEMFSIAKNLARPQGHASDSGLARRIWAQKIAELELRPNKHEDEITELGRSTPL